MWLKGRVGEGNVVEMKGERLWLKGEGERVWLKGDVGRVWIGKVW